MEICRLRYLISVFETTLQCFFDTPGLMLKKSGYGYKDIKTRVQNAWTSVDLFDVLIVMFDVHRHLMRLVICYFVCFYQLRIFS